MGSHNSTSIQDSVTNNVAIQTTINEQVNVSTNVSSQTITSQTINISVADPTTCCKGLNDTEYKQCTSLLASTSKEGLNGVSCPGGLIIKQTGTLKSTQSSKVTTTVTENIVSALSTTIQSQIENMITQSNDASGINSVFGAGNTAHTSTVITNSITNTLKSNLTSSTISSLRTQSGQVDITTLSTCYAGIKGKECNIDQEFSINLYQRQIVGVVGSIIATNKDAIKLNTELSNHSKQQNRNWLDNIEGMEKFFLIAIVAIIAIGGIMGLIAMMKMMSSHKHESHGYNSEKLSDGASSYGGSSGMYDSHRSHRMGNGGRGGGGGYEGMRGGGGGGYETTRGGRGGYDAMTEPRQYYAPFGKGFSAPR